MKNENNRKRIGGMIAAKRKALGFTTRQLAEITGINHSNISKIENGLYNVSIDILTRIAEPLGMEVTLLEK